MNRNNHSYENLTRSQRREIERRKRALETLDSLTAKGMSRTAAAKELRIGFTTLWRWRKSLIPQTANCGRKKMFEKLNPPTELLAKVRQLQLSGKGNADAWRAVADDPHCPSGLGEYLRSTRNVAPSLLAATRLTRRKAIVIEGPEFSLIRLAKKGAKA